MNQTLEEQLDSFESLIGWAIYQVHDRTIHAVIYGCVQRDFTYLKHSLQKRGALFISENPAVSLGDGKYQVVAMQGNEHDLFGEPVHSELDMRFLKMTGLYDSNAGGIPDDIARRCAEYMDERVVRY